ncbi:hypothetical protein ACFU5Y_04235 [Streptomyces gardneri]|uniref:hypothetical protein n=1 Tax=Streptomyces gardneri TaxID=66892 RepID=UPI0036D0FD7B
MTSEERKVSLYRFFDEAGRLLYVGVTTNCQQRCTQHRSTPWWPLAVRHSIEPCKSLFDGLRAEVAAIRTEAPLYNLRSTPAYKTQQSETARRISPEARQRRGVGVSARALQVRVLEELIAQGVPRPEASARALKARHDYKVASGLF